MRPSVGALCISRDVADLQATALASSPLGVVNGVIDSIKLADNTYVGVGPSSAGSIGSFRYDLNSVVELSTYSLINLYATQTGTGNYAAIVYGVYGSLDAVTWTLINQHQTHGFSTPGISGDEVSLPISYSNVPVDASFRYIEVRHLLGATTCYNWLDQFKVRGIA